MLSSTRWVVFWSAQGRGLVYLTSFYDNDDD